KKGDRVALAMRNLPEWPAAFFGTLLIGAIAVPLNAWWTGAELEYGLKDSGAKLVICDGERQARIAPHFGALPDLEGVIVSRSQTPLAGVERLAEILRPASHGVSLSPAERPDPARQPEHAATICYTARTTGNPK